jgi:hypothetical protein
MDKNVIDEDEVFAVNPNWSISVQKFNDVKVVIVDDFYKDPWAVRKLALDIPASYNKRIRGGNPALRVNAFYELSNLGWAFDQLISTYFDDVYYEHPLGWVQESLMRATFMVNVMQTDNLPPIAPHQDNPSKINIASTIYLNTPNECAGGTSFYTYNDKTTYDEPGNKTLDVSGKHPITQYITDSIGDFKMIGMVPMIFNRMVLYNQSKLHTAYVKPEMFTGNLYRLNQQFFI